MPFILGGLESTTLFPGPRFWERDCGIEYVAMVTNWSSHILYLHKSHNTPLLPPQNLHMHCFRFLLGHLHIPGEIANNDYAKFWGVKEVYYGICAVENRGAHLVESYCKESNISGTN